MLIVDSNKKGGEANFWQDIFLRCQPATNDFRTTQDYLKLCKDFIIEQIPSEYDVNRVEQIDYLNKSVDYFKKNEQFNKEEFEQIVFKQPELIESFRKYADQYQDDYEIKFDNSFEISDNAVKKTANIFKKVLKLDKNFHIYVHGNSDLIEKGFDEKVGLNYYKIYFEEEG